MSAAVDLFVIRHAIAVPRGGGRPDGERPLTPAGRDRFELEVMGLDFLGLHFETVHHSPLRRTAETAALLLPVTRGEIQPSDALARAPDDEVLALPRGAASVALVGHEPWCGELVAWLVVGDRERGGAFPFKKGGVVWLRGGLAPGCMAVRAAFPPKVLRALGRNANQEPADV
ncbi:MAG: histidine phosphatase family protein [Gemmatimonadota bacterium]|nr:histidine phosphatase family protein [Gemmatimonadota bacterium]MDH3421451.1 histidine phosphatase family protein [Gemmatimonadota bacterium]